MNYTAIIERIVETSLDRLNPWEHNFIENVYNECVLGDIPLSKKRKRVILQINRKLLS